jgi:hypothetical protein
MVLYDELRRPAAVRRIYGELEAALHEGLEAEPDSEIAALRNPLLSSKSPAG